MARTAEKAAYVAEDSNLDFYRGVKVVYLTNPGSMASS
jgi:hypothetical protein